MVFVSSDPSKFQSTLSVRRATHVGVTQLDIVLFQSTLSVRRATTTIAGTQTQLAKFQSTLSVRRATSIERNQDTTVTISIHALREESDEHEG